MPENKKKKPRGSTTKLWTRIIALLCAGLMLIGVATSIILGFHLF